MYGRHLGMQAGGNQSFLHDHLLHPQVPEEVCISVPVLAVLSDSKTPELVGKVWVLMEP
jgi:hypothetical protein